MPSLWFFDVTRAGSARAFPSGPYETEGAAAAARASYEAAHPEEVITAPYAASPNHAQSFPMATALIADGSGQDFVHWSDGAVEPAGA